MPSLFKNKYRNDTARLQSWNYANEGMYFITICTANRVHYFGDIVMQMVNDNVGTRCVASPVPYNELPIVPHNPQLPRELQLPQTPMALPQIKMLSQSSIRSIIQYPKMQLTEIGKIAESEWYKTVELRKDMNLESGEFIVMPDHIHGIIMIGENEYNSGNRQYLAGARDATHRVPTEFETKNKFGLQSKNLASIMRGYKSAVTTFARKNNIPFGWQPRFHEHIIRSLDEYNKISEYIVNNPAKWYADKLNEK